MPQDPSNLPSNLPSAGWLAGAAPASAALTQIPARRARTSAPLLRVPAPGAVAGAAGGGPSALAPAAGEAALDVRPVLAAGDRARDGAVRGDLARDVEVL